MTGRDGTLFCLAASQRARRSTVISGLGTVVIGRSGRPPVSRRRASARAWSTTPARRVVLLFGGWDDQQKAHGLADTWIWDGANWSKARPVTSPQPRGFAAMSYDSRERLAAVFGGHEAN